MGKNSSKLTSSEVKQLMDVTYCELNIVLFGYWTWLRLLLREPPGLVNQYMVLSTDWSFDVNGINVINRCFVSREMNPWWGLLMLYGRIFLAWIVWVWTINVTPGFTEGVGKCYFRLSEEGLAASTSREWPDEYWLFHLLFLSLSLLILGSPNWSLSLYLICIPFIRKISSYFEA